MRTLAIILSVTFGLSTAALAKGEGFVGGYDGNIYDSILNLDNANNVGGISAESTNDGEKKKKSKRAE